LRFCNETVNGTADMPLSPHPGVPAGVAVLMQDVVGKYKKARTVVRACRFCGADQDLLLIFYGYVDCVALPAASKV
jgi:hypothetical protein